MSPVTPPLTGASVPVAGQVSLAALWPDPGSDPQARAEVPTQGAIDRTGRIVSAGGRRFGWSVARRLPKDGHSGVVFGLVDVAAGEPLGEHLLRCAGGDAAG